MSTLVFDYFPRHIEVVGGRPDYFRTKLSEVANLHCRHIGLREIRLHRHKGLSGPRLFDLTLCINAVGVSPAPTFLLLSHVITLAARGVAIPTGRSLPSWAA